MYAFVVLGLDFPYQANRLAWGTSLKWPILCQVGRKNLNSINQFRHSVHFMALFAGLLSSCQSSRPANLSLRHLVLGETTMKDVCCLCSKISASERLVWRRKPQRVRCWCAMLVNSKKVSLHTQRTWWKSWFHTSSSISMMVSGSFVMTCTLCGFRAVRIGLLHFQSGCQTCWWNLAVVLNVYSLLLYLFVCWTYSDGAGNTVEENCSIFFLIQMS